MAGPVKGGHGDNQNPCGIYITNLPIYVRHSDIRRAFEKFGSIRDLYLPPTGPRRMRGIAYVEYDSPVQASEAMHNMQGKELVSRTISINYSGDYQTRYEVKRRRASRQSSYRHGRRRPYNDNLEERRSYSRNRSRSRSYSPLARGYRSRSYSPAPRHREKYHLSPNHSDSKSPRTWPKRQKRRRMSSSISPHHFKSPHERLDERKMHKRSYSPTPSSSSKSSHERPDERSRHKRSPSRKFHSSSADLSPAGRR